MGDILIIAELFEGKVRKSTLNSITFAKEAAGFLKNNFDILALGKNIGEAAQELSQYGAKKVYVADDPMFENYICENYADTIAKIVKEKGYQIVATTATAFGKDFIPRVAAKLDAGIASDITKIVFENNKILYQRPMYAGNVIAYLEIETPIHAVTIRQANFEAAAKTGSSSQIENVSKGVQFSGKKEFAGFEKVVSARPDLTEARVVVAGGRGLKSAEGFKNYIEPLADLLGAAIGATRAAVDGGFVPNDLQVGQTGKIVAPELYFAIGISGALQHLAGMKGSKVIVAINKDNEAPILQIADYGLVADLFKAVPELVEELKKFKN